MRTWHLGTIYGYDGERMKLPAENIAWQGCSVIAEKQIKKTGKICYYYLQPGKDKATGFHFQIEEESGSLKILDAGNLYGCELYLGGICTFSGRTGQSSGRKGISAERLPDRNPFLQSGTGHGRKIYGKHGILKSPVFR